MKNYEPKDHIVYVRRCPGLRQIQNILPSTARTSSQDGARTGNTACRCAPGPDVVFYVSLLGLLKTGIPGSDLNIHRDSLQSISFARFVAKTFVQHVRKSRKHQVLNVLSRACCFMQQADQSGSDLALRPSGDVVEERCGEGFGGLDMQLEDCGRVGLTA